MNEPEAGRDDPKIVFITLLARELHRAGVASDQLERTIDAIAERFSIPAEVLAYPTNILLAIGQRYAQRIVMLRIAPGFVNLRQLAILNEIVDELTAGTLDMTAAVAQLRSIDERAKRPGVLLSIAALAMVAFGVAVILGGGTHEMIVASFIGASTGALRALGDRVPAVRRLFDVLASFVATLIVWAYAHFIGPANLYISIVAGVVVLLPGYSLTLALNELANQDLIAGTARLGRVFAVLLSLGCGALLGFAAVGPHFVQQAAAQPHPVGATLWIGAAIVMAGGLSIDLNARARDYVWVLLASFVALAASHVFGALPAHQITPFLAAFSCGLVANFGARWLRLQQPIFLVPALHVLVPGSLSYESVLYVFSNNYEDAATLAVNAVVAAILIVAGLLLAQLLLPAAPLRLRRATLS